MFLFTFIKSAETQNSSRPTQAVLSCHLATPKSYYKCIHLGICVLYYFNVT